VPVQSAQTLPGGVMRPGQTKQVPPLVPQAALVVPLWQLPPETQPVQQLPARQVPPGQAAPLPWFPDSTQVQLQVLVHCSVPVLQGLAG